LSTPSNHPKLSRRPVAVDLFAGAGGLSLGLEQAGFDVAAAVEYDPVHAATHEFNFPATETICADVSTLKAETLREAVAAGLERLGGTLWDGEIDLIAGGPPCQGFSLIGRRLVDDKRNQLVFHFFRLVSELKPRYFVMENVPGMTKGGHAGILDRLIGEFEEAGYRFPDEKRYGILNAADFGVPQDRRRLFLIGTREDQARTAVAPSPTVAPVAKRSTEPRKANPDDLPSGPSVDQALGDLPNVIRFSSLVQSDETQLSDDALAELEAGGSDYARRLRGVQPDPGDFSRPRRWDRAVLTSSIRTAHMEKSIERFRRTKGGETEPVSRFYKLDPGGLCNTLRAGSGSERGAFTSPRPIHPLYPRVLTNREAARLHSFPDWFRLHATKWHGFRQIGNAVAPLVGRAVGGQVVEALGTKPVRLTDAQSPGEVALLNVTMLEAASLFGVSRESMPAPRTRGAVPSVIGVADPAQAVLV
jgi:DNA (cytosine-5)-methyltransferase 1